MEVTHDTNLHNSPHGGRLQVLSEGEKQQKGRKDFFFTCGISLDYHAHGGLRSIPNTPDTGCGQMRKSGDFIFVSTISNRLGLSAP